MQGRCFQDLSLDLPHASHWEGPWGLPQSWRGRALPWKTTMVSSRRMLGRRPQSPGKEGSRGVWPGWRGFERWDTRLDTWAFEEDGWGTWWKERQTEGSRQEWQGLLESVVKEEMHPVRREIKTQMKNRGKSRLWWASLHLPMEPDGWVVGSRTSELHQMPQASTNAAIINTTEGTQAGGPWQGWVSWEPRLEVWLKR